MALLPDIAPTHVLDALLAVTLTLALGRLILFFTSQPVVRRRICIFTLLGCLLAAPLGALPGVPRMRLGLVADKSLTVPNPLADVGLIPGTGTGVSRQPLPPSPQNPAESGSAQLLTISQVAWRAALATYLLCVVALALRLILGIVLVRRAIRAARPARGELRQFWRRLAPDSRVPLRISQTLPRPITAGIFSPIVLIPETLCDASQRDALEAVLLHELAHTRRRDTLACLLASVTHVLLFFHPLVWWATRDMRRAQEQLADAWAAGKMGDAELYVLQFVKLSKSVTWSTRLIMPVVEAFRRHGEFYSRMKYVLLHGQQVETRCRRGVTLAALLIIMASLAAGALSLGGKSSQAESLDASRITSIEANGVQFLLANQQPNGGWMTRNGPAITALVLKGLLRAGYTQDHPSVARALAYIESTQQSDGGFYIAAYPSYNTAIVVSTLALVPGPRYHERILKAHAFIQAMRKAANQNALQPLPHPQDAFYQASAEVEALRSIGLTAQDPDVRAAFQSMSEIASSSNGDRADHQPLPRYGTMTYAELKSLLYAGLSRDDPRVRGVLACIQEYYTLDHNPGDGSFRGQFYFYHSLAKAMHAYGEDVIVDSRGQRHNWKQELSTKLGNLQRADGSWINTRAQDYLENNPVLVTAYCVLALQEMR